HHLASHMWHVVNAKSLSPAAIAIVMRSPELHSGQLSDSGVITMESSASAPPFAIARRVHFPCGSRGPCRSVGRPTAVLRLGSRPGDDAGPGQLRLGTGRVREVLADVPRPEPSALPRV